MKQNPILKNLADSRVWEKDIHVKIKVYPSFFLHLLGFELDVCGQYF